MKRATEKTKQAIAQAVDQLLLLGRDPSVRVAEIIREADVGRSTFYDHFANSEEAMRQAFSRPFAVLARGSLASALDPAAGQLLEILQHFQQHRQRGLQLLESAATREQMLRALAGQYDCLLTDKIAHTSLRRMASRQLAYSNLAFLELWLKSGELDCIDGQTFLQHSTRNLIAAFVELAQRKAL